MDKDKKPLKVITGGQSDSEPYEKEPPITIVQMKEDKVGEAINIYNGTVVAAKSQKGYKGAYLLTDRDTGKNMSITIWDTEEDAVANERSGYYQEQVGRFKDIFKAPPVREGYEVSVQD